MLRTFTEAKDRFRQARGHAAADGSFGQAHDSSLVAEAAAVESRTRIQAAVDPAVLVKGKVEHYQDRMVGIPLHCFARTGSGSATSRLTSKLELTEPVRDALQQLDVPQIAGYEKHVLSH